MRRRAPGTIVLVCCFVCAAVAVRAQADVREGFEGPESVWRDAGGDARYRIDTIERAQAGAHTGNGCEYVRLSAGGNGRTAFLSYAVGRAPVIAELHPNVWVRCDRPGIQLFARVVLPRAIDTQTGQPMTTLVSGGQYTNVGTWQQLRIDDVAALVSRQAWVLRAQLRAEIDTREAFIDHVLLNAYTGAGSTNLWIDDLDVGGVVQPGAAAAADLTLVAGGPSGSRVHDLERRSTVELNGSVLLADGRPFFPRMIEHRGEPLRFLRDLGFNTVKLSSPPTTELLAEAQRVGIWLVCPPPSGESLDDPPGRNETLPELGLPFDRVLAWDLGSKLTARDLEAVKRRTEQLRRADPQTSRPILCEPETDLYSYSRRVDVLVLRREPLGTSFEQNDYGRWLREYMRLTRPGTPAWISIQTQPAPELGKQIELLSGGQAPEITFDVDQIRALAYTALSAGAGGICFCSRDRLDGSDATTHSRAAQLELLNLELELLESWTAAGSNVTVVAGSNHEPQKPPPSSNQKIKLSSKQLSNQPPKTNLDVTGFVLQTDRARLLLPIWSGGGSQFVPSQWAGNNLSFVIPGMPESIDVYEITPGGLRLPFRHQRVTGGIRVTLDEFSMTSMTVLTQDPLVINTLTQRLNQAGRRATELHRALAAQKLRFVTDNEYRLAAAGHTTIKTNEWLTLARASLQRSDQRWSENNLAEAYLEARRALRPLQRLQRAQWEEAIRTLSSPLTSPLAASYATLPEHYRLLSAVSPDRWGLSRLPAGDFESLDAMLRSGWQHLQNPRQGVHSEVELSSETRYAGRYSLRVAAKADDERATTGLIEKPSVSIVSPPVDVQAGQWVRIRGWVFVPTAIIGSFDGLRIEDSQNGEALAERIGQADKWRQFTMLRAMPQSGPLSIMFTLTGLGEVWIDDVMIEPLLPTGVTRASEQRRAGLPEELPPPVRPGGLPLDARFGPRRNSPRY